MNAESCSNCRFSVEEWRSDGVDENDADDMAAYVGTEPGQDQRNLFYCRRYPPTVNLSGYTVNFVEPDQASYDQNRRNNGGLHIFDDQQMLGVFPLSRPDYWCGEWSSR